MLKSKIFCTRSSEYLAKQISSHLNQPLLDVTFYKYSDGEFQPSLNETVRGCRVFIIGSTFPPVDNFMEILLLIDAAKRASAEKITVVIPYFGWARQDRKDKARVPIAAKMIANLLTSAGATRIMTMDLHADQIQGFFEIPVDHLFASSIFLPYLKSLNIQNLTMASPDMGGSKRAHSYAKMLQSDVIVCYKERKKANVINKMSLIGNVEGKNVVLVDDMIDTGGTLAKASQIMMDKGALSVRAICTHPVLSGNAIANIENSCLTELIVTDSIPIKETLSSKIKVLSCAPIFSKVINSLQNNESISDFF